MLKVLKNKNGFGLIGIIIAITVLMIMTASILPTFTARMNYKQAKYTVGVVRTIENAENAYMAKNSSFAPLTTLSANGYLSSTFLQSVQGGSYPQPNWINLEIANQTGSACIDNGGGCPNNPGVGNNGYFMGIYGIPHQYQTYIEHEIPGSGVNGTQEVDYVAPIPSAPPVATANYANTAGYANSSGLPAWTAEKDSLVGTTTYMGPTNTTGNTLYIKYWACDPSNGIYQAYAFVQPGGNMPQSVLIFIVKIVEGVNQSECIYYNNSYSAYVLRAYSG